MISQAQITTKPVVLQNLLLQLLYARLVFKLLVRREETLVKLDDLSKAQVLSGCDIKTSCYLYDLDQCAQFRVMVDLSGYSPAASRNLVL